MDCVSAEGILYEKQHGYDGNKTEVNGMRITYAK